MSSAAPLSEAKRRLLEQYLQGRTAAAPPPAIREPRLAPLSFAAEQIWRRAQASAGLPAFYNESLTVHRRGPLDAAALQRALTEIIRRHEIWRTTFELVDGAPVQIVHAAPDRFPLRVADLRGNPQPELEALRLATDELRCPFDLAAGPLVRFTLARLADAHYRLYVAAHQIILDGVSAYHVFFPELVALYEAFAEGRPSPLPGVPVQYADCAFRQRQSRTERMLAAQLDYWRRQFAPGVPDLRWPAPTCDRPQNHRGRIHAYALRESVAQGTKQFSQRRNTTLFTTLVAAYAVLLHRCTGQRGIVIGTVLPSGRDFPDAQHTMGYLLMPVGLRVELAPELTFADVLDCTCGVILGALANTDVPYETVAVAVDPNAATACNPLFKIAASLEPAVPGVAPGWDLTPMDVESGGTRWPLYFVWEDRPPSISGRVQFNPDLFTLGDVTAMVADFERLLELVTRRPQLRIADLPRFAEPGRLRS